jgi:hypothetical protein
MKAAIPLSLFLGLYGAPSIARSFLLPWAGWLPGLVVCHFAVCWMAGFLANRYSIAVLGFAASAVLETAVLLASGQAALAIWIGGLIPASAAVYFARRLYLGMGD